MKLDMIGIVVANMAESLRFYRLLDVQVEEPPEGEPYVETSFPNGLRLSWNDIEMMKSLDPEWEEPKGQRLGLAFLCHSASEVDREYEKVLNAGFTGKRAPWDAFWGQRYALLLDPDGNEIALFAPLSG